MDLFEYQKHKISNPMRNYVRNEEICMGHEVGACHNPTTTYTITNQTQLRAHAWEFA